MTENRSSFSNLVVVLRLVDIGSPSIARAVRARIDQAKSGLDVMQLPSYSGLLAGADATSVRRTSENVTAVFDCRTGTV